MELLSFNIKKNPGNRNPKKASYILENETFQSTLIKFLMYYETEASKDFLIFSLHFNLNFLHFRKWKPQKMSYALGNGTFLYFKKY